MRKCRNWQTSKTKDLVIIAIVWVQVPSSALNNKTGIKQSVWSLSYCSKPKRALNPWFKVSPPARSARGMRSPGPHSPHLPHGSDCCGAGAHGSRSRLRLGRCRTDVPPDVLQPVFRKASVIAWQAPHGSKVSAPLRSLQNRRPSDVLQPIFRTPSSTLKWGKLNYTDFVQNCILDQKERTSL